MSEPATQDCERLVWMLGRVIDHSLCQLRKILAIIIGIDNDRVGVLF